MTTHNVLRHRTEKLAPGERDILEAAVSGLKVFPAGHIVVHQGKPMSVSVLLVKGFMTRHVDAQDGRRHLVGLHLPGDFVDLHAYTLKKLDHDVGALNKVEVAIVPHVTLERIHEDHPSLMRRLWFLTLLDAAMHRQWICRLSSLTALERVAHFLCEMNARLLAIGASDGRSFALPMTQVDFGEVCGLTNVHVNRVLRQLREMGLCTVRSFNVALHDLQGLATIGKFHPGYLYLDHPTMRRASGHPEESPS